MTQLERVVPGEGVGHNQDRIGDLTIVDDINVQFLELRVLCQLGTDLRWPKEIDASGFDVHGSEVAQDEVVVLGVFEEFRLVGPVRMGYWLGWVVIFSLRQRSDDDCKEQLREPGRFVVETFFCETKMHGGSSWAPASLNGREPAMHRR